MLNSTVEELFELAIQIENTCQALYESMEGKFAHQPEIVSYWHCYALEEAGHARWLADLRSRSTRDELEKKASDEVLLHAKKMLKFTSDQAGKHVHDLEEAYQVATELENSETNAVFEFLIANYAGDQGTVNFLRTQLKVHMSNLQTNLPRAYQSKSARRSLKAL
jgi:DNA-binding GntR family transcriptional regulator